ncbi:phage tail protein [Burkholderia cepacia]|uniref:phage tail protein n=1 Tax=Burkholderia cepacia TaxID=292 RepID=UPI000752E06B|nr:phage tail protein [Burkholderia cepacia]KWF99099.1 hypothetical protein WL95_00345 [Burkholderia cepacia]
MFLEFFLNLVISTILSELLKPKQHYDTPAPAGIGDFTFPTASEDRAIPVLWGTRKLTSTNSLWHGDLQQRPITQTVRQSLFSKQTITTGYDYFLGMQLGLCVADVDRVEAIWCGDVNVFTATANQATVNTTLPILGRWKEGSSDSGVSGTMVVRSGNATAEPYMATQVALNPAFPHMTYAVFVGPSAGSGLHYVGPTTGGKGNGWVGISPNIRPFDFVLRRMPKVVQYGIAQADFDAYSAVGGRDANPAYCLLELLCNTDWGAGIPPQLVDLDSFHAAAQVLAAEGNGCSLLWDSVQACQQIATQLIKQMNACLYTDITTGLVKLHMIRPGDAIRFALTDDNITRMTSFTRAGTDESTNCVRVSFNDTNAGFIDRVAVAQDLGGVEQAGQVITATVQYPGVSSAVLAPVLATRDLRAAAASLSKFQLKAVLPVGLFLHPGDLCSLTFSPHAINAMAVRVVTARYSDASKGEVDLTLVEDIFLPGTGLYSASVPPIGVSPSNPNLPTTLPAGSLETWKAPYAWTGEEADHLMAVAYAPDAITTGYDLGFWTADPSVLEWHNRGNVGFAARGYLTGTIARAPTLGSITFTVDAANAATLTRYGNLGSYFLIDQEEFYASSVSLAGNVATLSGIKRALHDTVPQAHAQGAQVTVLCDYVIDVARLQTQGFADGNATLTPDVFYDGVQAEGVRALSRNVYGAATTLSPAFSGGRNGGDFGGTGKPPGYVRAMLPYPPGKLQLAGSFGGGDQASAVAVTVPTTQNVVVTFQPRNRLALSDSAWSDGDLQGEPGVYHQVYLDKWNGTSWVNVTSATVNPGATPSASFASSGIARPSAVRVRITPYRYVNGTSSMSGTTQTWYWTLN